MNEKRATVKAHEWAAWDRRGPAGRGAAAPTAATAPLPSGAPVVPPPPEPVPAIRPGPGPAPANLPPSEPAPAKPPRPNPVPAEPRASRLEPGGTAEVLRRRFADAWGTVGPEWGVAPATARVHGYLLAHRRALTEREVREALGLSHRAASIALAESEAWGLVERVPEPRRVGRRGPAGTAWVAVGDHWRWFGRVVEQRRLREGDPTAAAIASASAAADTVALQAPGDGELAGLRDWLADFLEFVRLFDRAAALVARVPPDTVERGMRLLGEIPDEQALRLVALLAAVPDQDARPLLAIVAALPPGGAPRAARIVARALRPLAR